MAGKRLGFLDSISKNIIRNRIRRCSPPMGKEAPYMGKTSPYMGKGIYTVPHG